MSKEIKAGHITLGWYIYRIKFSNKGRKLRGRTDIVEWCQTYCKGRWAHVSPETMTFHTFYIEDKNDAMMFKLSWVTDKPKFQEAWKK